VQPHFLLSHFPVPCARRLRFLLFPPHSGMTLNKIHLTSGFTELEPAPLLQCINTWRTNTPSSTFLAGDLFFPPFPPLLCPIPFIRHRMASSWFEPFPRGGLSPCSVFFGFPLFNMEFSIFFPFPPPLKEMSFRIAFPPPPFSFSSISSPLFSFHRSHATPVLVSMITLFSLPEPLIIHSLIFFFPILPSPTQNPATSPPFFPLYCQSKCAY